MKKVFTFIMVALVAFALTGCRSRLQEQIDEINDRLTVLEDAVLKTNSDIIALKNIINALQNNVYVTSVETTNEGYIIHFSDGTSANISNGKDGTNGKDGANAPAISVRQDTDGNYYWTLDGEWLLVDGEKVRANGMDGANGVTPQVRINEDTKEWEISVDGGNTWEPTGVIAEGKDGENGLNGANGENGSTPQISIKKDTDGNYYWTLDGEWILVDGAKVRANGFDGGSGSNGIAPQIRINTDTKEWEVSTDGGLTWTSTGVLAQGSNGDSFFQNVDTSNPDYVIVTMADGSVFLLARYDGSAPLFIITNAPQVAQVEYGTTATFNVETENIMEYLINVPEGWKADYNANILTVTAPAKDLCHFDKEGTIAITVVSEAGKMAIVKLNVMAGEWVDTMELRVLTFEDKDAKFESYYLDYADDWAGREITTWSELVDDPQYSGPLMYGSDAYSAMYTWWDEGNTELTHTFPENNGAYCFWGGGHAISNYWGEGFTNEDRDKHIAKYYGQDYVDAWAGNDAMLGWFTVQLMTPVPAHSGDNFVVHYGYKDFFTYIENLPEISFADGEPRIIDHMYVTNTNYTLNQLCEGVMSEAGNTFGGSWEGLTDDAWMKIVASGFENIDDEEPTSEVEFYLVQGKDVVVDWQKWDLTGLGEVAKVQFNFLYSEEMGGKYGFTIPGYFAYDDVAVQFPGGKKFE